MWVPDQTNARLKLATDVNTCQQITQHMWLLLRKIWTLEQIRWNAVNDFINTPHDRHWFHREESKAMYDSWNKLWIWKKKQRMITGKYWTRSSIAGFRPWRMDAERKWRGADHNIHHWLQADDIKLLDGVVSNNLTYIGNQCDYVEMNWAVPQRYLLSARAKSIAMESFLVLITRLRTPWTESVILSRVTNLAFFFTFRLRQESQKTRC